MKTMINTNVIFEKRMSGKLPKSVGYSGLFRWALHLAVDSEEEFEKALLNDAGLAAAERYMIARIKRMVGK